MDMDTVNDALADNDIFRLFGLRPSRKTPYSDITHTKGKPKKRVKRPMNSFMAFSFFERKKICSENPKIHNAEVSRKLGNLWRQTSFDQKRLFEKIANILKIYHEIEFPDYKYRPQKKVKRPSVATATGVKKPVRKRMKKVVSGKENDDQCSPKSESEPEQQQIVVPESVLTPPSSAPMTPDSGVVTSPNFPSGFMTDGIAASISNHFWDMLPLEGDSQFMDNYESENSCSSLTFSSSSADLQPFTDNQLMLFDPLTDEGLLL